MSLKTLFLSCQIHFPKQIHKSNPSRDCGGNTYFCEQKDLTKFSSAANPKLGSWSPCFYVCIIQTTCSDRWEGQLRASALGSTSTRTCLPAADASWHVHLALHICLQMKSFIVGTQCKYMKRQELGSIRTNHTYARMYASAHTHLRTQIYVKAIYTALCRPGEPAKTTTSQNQDN